MPEVGGERTGREDEQSDTEQKNSGGYAILQNSDMNCD